MSTHKTNSQRLLCFADVFRDEDILQIKQFAEARAYRIGSTTLLLCSFKPFGQDTIDRALSFGWKAHRLPLHGAIPKLIAEAQEATQAETAKQPPGRPPSRLSQTERNAMVHHFGETDTRGVWKKSRKL